MIRSVLLTGALALTATGAFAKSGEAPASTPTSESCEDGQVWSEETKLCVDAESHLLEDDQRYEAARELAFVGDYDRALMVLAAMAEGDTPRVLTMRGFATRKAGDFEAAKAMYYAALEIDPDHWDARSYLGQGFVEAGNSTAARAQLTLIRVGGGRGTWAEISLRNAIERGAGYSY